MDIIGTPESNKSVRDRIYSPRLLVAKLLIDNKFKSQIVGCSTFSLSQVVRNISPKEITIQPYGSSNSIMCELNSDVYESLFGGEQDSGFKYILENQKYAGVYWASLELAKEYQVPDEMLWAGDSFKHSLATISYALEKVDDSTKVKALLPNLIEKVTDKKNYQRAFGNLEKATKYFMDLKQRGGVQIIYSSLDKQDFVNFVNSAKHNPEDDRAVQIYNKSIPNKFISAIVPLGNYEAGKLRNY